MNFLSNVIIGPIKTLLEIFFNFFYKVTRSNGISVIGLSFVVTLGCLPLYVVAEKWQEIERQTQKKMKGGLDRIKKAFSGDERYMITQTFYREHQYSPIMSLRSSFGLLIQIPFFIAAYSFLSNLQTLNGTPFFFIRDLGKPDGLLRLGNFQINFLPIAMTLINMISGAIYTKGHPLREKIQVYGMALLFLVVLYKSPAGLVLYWTMNNVLSMVKNIFYKMKNPLKVLHILASIAAVAIAIFFFRTKSKLYIVFFSLFAVFVILLPLILKYVTKVVSYIFSLLDIYPKTRCIIFVLTCITLAITAGITIPAIIIDSSSSDYFYIDTYTTPFPFIFHSFSQAIGLFVFWPICIYALMSQKVKDTITLIWVSMALTGLANCFIFSGNYGLMNVDFSLMDEAQSFNLPPLASVLQVLVTIAIFAAIILSIKKKPAILRSVFGITLISIIGVSVWTLSSINRNFKGTTPQHSITELKPEFHFSKEGQNVLVFMADRFESAFMQDILNEHPNLKSKLDGFTYFPNTVSMSYNTSLGAPGLFGGYDFTPWEVNKRKELSIREKHNQSLLVMPTLFTNSGFDVTVTNLPYENYNQQPVEQIYKDLPNLRRVKTQGAYTEYWYKSNNMKPPVQTSFLLKRNMIFFSLFKLTPPQLRVITYGLGYRLLSNPYSEFAYTIDTYAPMDFLSELSDTHAKGNQFILFDTELPHAAGLLQAPEYIPVENYTNTSSSRFSLDWHYNVDCATLLRLAEFFEWMKANGVYDNTRIIIVSDHGNGTQTGLFNQQIPNCPKIKEEFQALLMIKDFGSRGELSFDNTFMTNADVPTEALKGICENPKNPFTGNPLNVEDKSKYVKISSAPMQSLRTRDDKAFTVGDNEWITVHTDIFNDDNWSYYNIKSEEYQEAN